MSQAPSSGRRSWWQRLINPRGSTFQDIEQTKVTVSRTDGEESRGEEPVSPIGSETESSVIPAVSPVSAVESEDWEIMERPHQGPAFAACAGLSWDEMLTTFEITMAAEDKSAKVGSEQLTHNEVMLQMRQKYKCRDDLAVAFDKLLMRSEASDDQGVRDDLIRFAGIVSVVEKASLNHKSIQGEYEGLWLAWRELFVKQSISGTTAHDRSKVETLKTQFIKTWDKSLKLFAEEATAAAKQPEDGRPQNPHAPATKAVQQVGSVASEQSEAPLDHQGHSDINRDTEKGRTSVDKRSAESREKRQDLQGKEDRGTLSARSQLTMSGPSANTDISRAGNAPVRAPLHVPIRGDLIAAQPPSYAQQVRGCGSTGSQLGRAASTTASAASNMTAEEMKWARLTQNREKYLAAGEKLGIPRHH